MSNSNDQQAGEARHVIATAGWNAAAWVLAAGVAAVAVWAGVAAVVRIPNPLYRLDTVDIGLIAVAVVLLLGGAAGLVASPRPDVAVLVLAAATLGLIGVLAMFSIGMVLVAAAAVPVVGAARRLRHSTHRAGGATGAGIAAAVGLSLALLAWPHGPVVECHQNGASTTGSWRDQSGSGHIETRPDGTTHGTLRFDDEAYRYRCSPHGGLVEFERLS